MYDAGDDQMAFDDPQADVQPGVPDVQQPVPAQQGVAAAVQQTPDKVGVPPPGTAPPQGGLQAVLPVPAQQGVPAAVQQTPDKVGVPPPGTAPPQGGLAAAADQPGALQHTFRPISPATFQSPSSAFTVPVPFTSTSANLPITGPMLQAALATMTTTHVLDPMNMSGVQVPLLFLCRVVLLSDK